MLESSDSIYKSSGYARSRKAYIIQCAFEYFVSLMVADAFLAKLLRSMGASDALCGIISSFISLAMLFQLASLFVVGRITNTKKVAVAVHGVSQFLFTALYLVPFLPMPDSIRRPVFIVCMLLAYFGNYLVVSVIFKWGMSFVDPRKRAGYSSVKEMVSLASGIIVSLSLGAATDAFDGRGNTRGGFLLIAVCMAVFSLCDLICLLLIKNEPVKEKSQREPLLPALKFVFTDKSFLSVLLVQCAFNAAVYSTIGFMGTYKQAELMYSVGQIQIINVAGVICRFAVSRPFGRFSDRHTYHNGILLGLILMSLGFFINVFTAPGTRWLVIVYTLLYSIACAGTSQNFNNITFSCVPDKYFVHATVIKNSIAGVVGFLATLVSGKLMDHIQKGDNTFLGLHVYSQQVQSAISVLLLGITVLLLVNAKRSLKKQRLAEASARPSGD